MNRIILFNNLFLLIFTFYNSTEAQEEWSYENQDDWPESCLAENQSPIRFNKDASERGDPFEIFELTGYGDPIKAHIINTGRFLQVKSADSHPQLTLSRVSSEGYNYSHSVFHWLSEHKITGRTYPLEQQLIHFAEKYGDYDSALNHEDGIAIMAVPYSKSFDTNLELNKIIDSVPNVKDKVNDPVEIVENINLERLLPLGGGYYRYNGTLTYPNCNPAMYVVRFKTVHITQEQLDNIKNINDKNGETIEFNARKTQPVNERPVIRNFN